MPQPVLGLRSSHHLPLHRVLHGQRSKLLMVGWSSAAQSSVKGDISLCACNVIMAGRVSATEARSLRSRWFMNSASLLYLSAAGGSVRIGVRERRIIRCVALVECHRHRVRKCKCSRVDHLDYARTRVYALVDSKRAATAHALNRDTRERGMKLY